MKDLRALTPRSRIRQLDNGLTVCVVEDRRSPVVAVSIVYRAGGRDEAPEHSGVAHFLEHMMFKGSPGFGPGEVDHVTQVLGGSNNAFTSHDATVYYFTFAADRWLRALEIEADRMAALTLDAAEIDSERRVILEEIAMYESDPWDALEMRVAADFFGAHPYGRPVLGTPGTLSVIDAGVLRGFHQRFYRPANAVLVIAGDVGPETDAAVDEAFGRLNGGPSARSGLPAVDRPRDLRRLDRRQGEVPRLLLTLPAPGGDDPEHPLVMLLSAVLGCGRTSRLYRTLVDDGQLCAWVTTELVETVDPGALVVALEVVPGVEPRRVEEALLASVARLRAEGPSPEEVERVQKMLLADWIFGHERVHQLALLMGSTLALFDPDHPWRYLERLMAARACDLKELADRTLRPEAGGVLGWSLPKTAA